MVCSPVPLVAHTPQARRFLPTPDGSETLTLELPRLHPRLSTTVRPQSGQECRWRCARDPLCSESNRSARSAERLKKEGGDTCLRAWKSAPGTVAKIGASRGTILAQREEGAAASFLEFSCMRSSTSHGNSCRLQALEKKISADMREVR